MNHIYSHQAHMGIITAPFGEPFAPELSNKETELWTNWKLSLNQFIAIPLINHFSATASHHPLRQPHWNGTLQMSVRMYVCTSRSTCWGVEVVDSWMTTNGQWLKYGSSTILSSRYRGSFWDWGMSVVGHCPLSIHLLLLLLIPILVLTILQTHSSTHSLTHSLDWHSNLGQSVMNIWPVTCSWTHTSTPLGRRSWWHSLIVPEMCCRRRRRPDTPREMLMD